MARVVLFTYGGDLERDLRRAFAAAGHDFRPIEPDYPGCKGPVEAANPEIFLLDPATRPGHVRQTAAYFADLKRYRACPVFVVGGGPEALAKVRTKIPRAEAASPEDLLARVAARPTPDDPHRQAGRIA